MKKYRWLKLLWGKNLRIRNFESTCFLGDGAKSQVMVATNVVVATY